MRLCTTIFLFHIFNKANKNPITAATYQLKNTPTESVIVRKTEKEMIVVPAITDGGYNFSKDSEKEIEKQVREFIKEGKIRISDPVEYGSSEMFLELVGYEK